MKIVINNHRKIFAIQEEFNNLFPGLKIKFHAKSSKSGAASSVKLVVHSGRTLQDCRTTSKQGTITILPTMNVSDLKENFSNVYGLSVEISRKGNPGGIENPLSDKLTLEENNSKYSA